MATGRFDFLKDTSCRLATMRSRIAAGRNRHIRLFNANTPTLLASLMAGADGYSGIGANYLPRLYSWLTAHHASDPGPAEALSQFLTILDPFVATRYPGLAKQFLHEAGLRIQPHCRIPQPVIDDEGRRLVRALHPQAAEWHRILGLENPLPPASSSRPAR
jgi:4-hydroxy-tetrahydrodipicolinate synthase